MSRRLGLVELPAQEHLWRRIYDRGQARRHRNRTGALGSLVSHAPRGNARSVLGPAKVRIKQLELAERVVAYPWKCLSSPL
jgi:hypothetical protein